MPGKMIGGVAAGLADYLEIDATIVRLLFVLATFFHGAGLLIYIVLWIAMPAGTGYRVRPGQPGGVNPVSPGSPEPPLQNPVQRPEGNEPSGRRSAAVIGWILVGLGVFFLMDEFLEPWFREFFYWFNFRRIWPVVFIIVGVLIISSAAKKAPGYGPEEDPLPPGGPKEPPAGGPGTSAGSGINPEQGPATPQRGPMNPPPGSANPPDPANTPPADSRGPMIPPPGPTNTPPATPPRGPMNPPPGPANAPDPGKDDTDKF